MKFKNFLNELSSIYGKGITFVDIDETIFRTFAKIYVIDKETKEIDDIVVYSKDNKKQWELIKGNKDIIEFEMDKIIDIFLKYDKGNVIVNNLKKDEYNNKIILEQQIQSKLKEIALKEINKR
jgi:hypothetical protein